MAVDLASLPPNRQSLLLAADAIIRLEHQLGRDRVRRILYEHLQSVMVRREVPWVQMTAVTVGLGVPAFVIAVAVPPGGIIVSVLMLILLALLVGLLGWWRKTVIRIVWSGQQYDFSGVVWPGAADRFITRLHEAVGHARTAAQKLAAERAAASESPIPMEEITGPIPMTELPPMPLATEPVIDPTGAQSPTVTATWSAHNPVPQTQTPPPPPDDEPFPPSVT